jgi:RimJ/RimL family protein N-acetyltransferase
MCSMIGHWQVRGYGPYAVEEKTSGNIPGTVGFWYPNDWPDPEIKWGLARRYWGQGFATEAATLVHAAGREHLPDFTLISLIHDDNKASIGVALTIGAQRERSIDYEGEPHGVYRHKTTTWPKLDMLRRPHIATPTTREFQCTFGPRTGGRGASQG